MIQITDLNKRYGSKLALKELTCQIHKGMINGLVGPNGSGKTTLIHCILNQMEYDGEVLWRDDHSSLFFIPDENILPDLLTGTEYLKFIESLYKVKNDPYKMELISAFDMESDVHQAIHTYSYGMKKKIQIIGGLLIAPDMLILDEIFRGLDMMAILTTKKYLLSYVRQGKTVLLSSHDILAIEQLCSYILLLVKGNLKANGAPEQLLKEYSSDNLESLFLELIQ